MYIYRSEERRSRRGRLCLHALLGFCAGASVEAPALAQEAVPAAATPSAVPSAEPAPAAAPRQVDINEYYVEGNTVLSAAEIEAAVYPFLGPGKTTDDVERARAALQKLYETKGYKTVFVEVPQQNVVAGRVRLAVTEARVGQVAVKDAHHVSAKHIEAELSAIAPGTVPDLNRFTDQLQALNAVSNDRQVTPDLKAGAAPGTIDVNFDVHDKLALHGGLEFDNRYSRDTTHDRLQANLRYDDLWGLGHSISGFYAVAPERRKDSEVFDGAYGLPLTDHLRLDITGLVSNSDVATIGSTDVLGDGHSVTATLTRTLGGPAGVFQRVSASVAYKDFKENTTFGGITSKSPITYFPVSLGYSGVLSGDRSEFDFGLTGTFAFRGLGSDAVSFDNKRFHATGAFAYLHGSASYRYDLPRDAQIYTSIEGQVASEPLISNEEFSLGGEGSVRGYLQSEAVGDQGFVTSLELRSPSFAGLAHGVFEELRAIAFVDAGKLWLRYPLPDQQASFAMISVGPGLRMKLLNKLSGDLDLGIPLRSSEATHVGDVRLHFRLAADF